MKKIDDLIEKNGKFFEKNSIQPFTGKVEGQIKGYLKDGMPEGTWQEFSQKGKRTIVRPRRAAGQRRS